jgi:heptosyltransferase-3
MKNVLDRLPEQARVLIVRLRSLGDCVLTTPAIEILKRARPDVRVDVMVEDRFAAVFHGNPHVNAVLPPSRRAALIRHPGLTINFHGGARSMQITALSLARHRAGFAHHRGNWVYNLKIPTAQEILGVRRKVHTAEHLASAIFWLGAPFCEIPRASLYVRAPRGGSRYAVLHPMASEPAKTWPAERFRETAAWLLHERGFQPIFIGGANDDMTPFRDFEVMQGAPLEEVKELLAGASLFIGNDSGPAHMAAAFGKPVVVLFGRSDPIVWAPWKTTAKPLVDEVDIAHIHSGQVKAAVDLVMQQVEQRART